MHCTLCNGTTFETLREKLRHDIVRKVFRCTECGLVFLDQAEANAQEFYNKQYRKLYPAVIGKELTPKEFFNINMPFQRARLEKIRHLLKPDMRVLDIGSSAGMFLNEIRPHVGEVIGDEFDEVYAQFARDTFGITTYTTPLEETDLAPNSFDLISALEVFEHIADPLRFLETVKRYLKPGGILYCEVPNHDESLLSIFDVPGYRDFYYREPHLFYYNPDTLKRMLERAGFHGTIAASGFEPHALNQMHWILNGRPQPSATNAYGEPTLPLLSTPNPAAPQLFEAINRFHRDYRALLDRALLCSHIIFIGQ